MSSKTDRKVKLAIKSFSKYHGKEVTIRLLKQKNKKVLLSFGGNICNTCGIFDYFEDFLFLLEEYTSTPWIISSVREVQNEFQVEYTKAKFIEEIERLKQIIGEKVREKIREFEEMKNKNDKEIFKELCFCILTANFSAERGIKIQKEVDEGFIYLSKSELEKKLRELGHRFPRTRAEYIFEARKSMNFLRNIISSKLNGKEIREILVREIKGIGYKEASHFLRNIGYKDVAIVDRHILKFLVSYGIVEKEFRSLNKKRYLEIESKLEFIARRINVSLAELDFYIWYMMTRKILK